MTVKKQLSNLLLILLNPEVMLYLQQYSCHIYEIRSHKNYYYRLPVSKMSEKWLSVKT